MTFQWLFQSIYWLFWSITEIFPPDLLFLASCLQRSQIAAGMKLQKGCLGFQISATLQKSPYMLWKSNWKVIKFYWWISVWTLIYSSLCIPVYLQSLRRVCLLDGIDSRNLTSHHLARLQSWGNSKVVEVGHLRGSPVNMSLDASTGPLLAHNGMFMGSRSRDFRERLIITKVFVKNCKLARDWKDVR